MIFVDSSIWDAAQNERDQNHDLAEEILHEIGNGTYGTPLVTDYIIDEVLTWIHKKVSHSAAVKMSEKFFSDQQIEIEKVDWATFTEAETFSRTETISHLRTPQRQSPWTPKT